VDLLVAKAFSILCAGVSVQYFYKARERFGNSTNTLQSCDMSIRNILYPDKYDDFRHSSTSFTPKIKLYIRIYSVIEKNVAL